MGLVARWLDLLSSVGSASVSVAGSSSLLIGSGDRITADGVVLKHKNVSSIEEYNIGDRLKYSRIKQSSKKDIEESRINVKYQEHYRSIWNSAKCKMQSAKYKVQSAKCNIETSGIMQSTKRGAKLQSKGIIRTKAKFWYIPLHSFSVLCSFLIGVSLV